MKTRLFKGQRMISLGLMVACISVLGFAKAPSANATPEPATTVASSAPAPAPAATPAATTHSTPATPAKEPEKKILCPEVESLVKENLIWKAPGGWRSYSQSFVTEIKGFVGAQWVGVKVGKMMCIYQGSEEVTFPVVLQNDQLVPQPEGGAWGTSTHGGYVNCKSGIIEDCHFTYKKEETDMGKVYEELDFFKDRKDPLKDATP